MRSWLIALKQLFERWFPQGDDRFWFYMMLGLGLIIAGAMLLACGAQYTDTHLVKTNWYGRVDVVEGGTQKASGVPWIGDVADVFGATTWLLIVGALVLMYLLYKFPALLRHYRAKRDARSLN